MKSSLERTAMQSEHDVITLLCQDKVIRQAKTGSLFERMVFRSLAVGGRPSRAWNCCMRQFSAATAPVIVALTITQTLAAQAPDSAFEPAVIYRYPYPTSSRFQTELAPKRQDSSALKV